MDKKIYIKPACEVVEVDMKDSLLISTSPGIDNEAADGIQGRIRRQEDRFTDVWGNEY